MYSGRILYAAAGSLVFGLIVLALYGSEESISESRVARHSFECFEDQKWIPCDLPVAPYMLVTSDIHLSSADGRWPETTGQFERFLEIVSKTPPELIFIVGDIVDNSIDNYPGSVANWKSEWKTYESIKKTYYDIEFRQSYGTGHDWLNDEMLGTLDQEIGSRHGVLSWRDMNFVWLSFGPGANFPNSNGQDSDLEEEDILWLESVLSDVDQVSLMFHVPLLTKRSQELGTVSNGRLIVLDPRDPLYRVVDTYREKIDYIFNGHIHKAFQHSYRGIEMFSCPLKDARSFCTIEEIRSDSILIARAFS